MGFALIGLVGLQFYWVNQAYEVNRERFRIHVHDALDKLVRNLEQREVVFLAQNKENNQIKIEDILHASIENDTSKDEIRKEITIRKPATEKRVIREVIKPKDEQVYAQASFIEESNEVFQQKSSNLQQRHPKFNIKINLNEQTAMLDIPFNTMSSLETFGRRNEVLQVWLDSTENIFFQADKIPSNLFLRSMEDNSKLMEFKLDTFLMNPHYAAEKTFTYKRKIKKTEENVENIKSRMRFETKADISSKKDIADPDKVKSVKPLTWEYHKTASDAEYKERKPLVRIENKSDMVAYIIEELQNKPKKIENRINQKLIDSLLKKELDDEGIQLDYQFLVESIPNDRHNIQYLYCDKPEIQKKVTTAGFNTHLFPTEIGSGQNILHVYFPDESSFIIQKMGWVLGSSVLFIGLVIYCFAQAIFTILRQKKVSEITNDFINNMTHEFKTPISTVSLACEALQDPDIKQLPEQNSRYLNIIKEENERLGRQVEKVLQIAVLDKGDFKLKVNSLDMHELLTDAMRNIVIQVENRQGQILTDFQADKTEILADELHISNVIHNLLDNAIKYSPDSPEIKIKTYNNEEGVFIDISDKGQGMAKETINKVFDKFYRVPTGNIHNVKGFGLGLSYVKTMVEAHHGDIKVKSDLNKGSTFTIFLPYKQAPSPKGG